MLPPQPHVHSDTRDSCHQTSLCTERDPHGDVCTHTRLINMLNIYIKSPYDVDLHNVDVSKHYYDVSVTDLCLCTVRFVGKYLENGRGAVTHIWGNVIFHRALHSTMLPTSALWLGQR